MKAPFNAPRDNAFPWGVREQAREAGYGAAVTTAAASNVLMR
jgi:hypothetical protein